MFLERRNFFEGAITLTYNLREHAIGGKLTFLTMCNYNFGKNLKIILVRNIVEYFFTFWRSKYKYTYTSLWEV